MGSATLEAVIPATGVDIVGKAQDLCEVYPLMPECSPEIPSEAAEFLSRDDLGVQSGSPSNPSLLETYFQPQASILEEISPDLTGADAASPWQSAEEVALSPGAALLAEFDAIHQKYERRVYRQCYRMLRNQEDAEDLTQEVFLQLFRKAHTFRGEANFSTWLHRLTINTVLMRMRRSRRWRDLLTSMDATPGFEQDSGDVLTLVRSLPAPPASTVDKISLDVAIAQLSAGYKEVFLLHDAEGYRHDEIAKMLGISEGTSKSQLHKARFRLRELIDSTKSGSSATTHEMATPEGSMSRRRSSRTGEYASNPRQREIPSPRPRSRSHLRAQRPAAA